MYKKAEYGSSAVLSVGLRPLACWYCGAGSNPARGWLSFSYGYFDVYYYYYYYYYYY